MREREAREIPGLRYETCRGCGLRWNIAKGQTIPKDGYEDTIEKLLALKETLEG